MSAQTQPRYENGVRVPSNCRFCGSPDMGANSDWTAVNRHSHDGHYVTVLFCRDCGGQFVTVERGNKRVTTMDDMTTVEERWDIPEGYCMTVCSACGELAGAHDLREDKPLLEAIERGDITTSCCGARGEFEGETFEVGR